MIETQSIRYSGSKAKILNKIYSVVNPLDITKVLDGFSGSTRVSQLFKGMGYEVHSNDLAIYSKVLAECYLLNKKPKEYYQPIIEELNNLDPVNGWFSEHYGGYDYNGLSIQSDGKKKPYQIHNAMKLDAIRSKIDLLYPNDCIEKSVLLTSLLLALDKVQNDLGHQVSYLKQWAPKTYNVMELKVPMFFIDEKKHKVCNKDIFSIDGEYDLVYIDPPYGTSNQQTPTSRVRYFSYYHLWTTIVKNDKPFLFGAAGRREDVSSDSKEGAVSVFESTDIEVVEKSFIDMLNVLTSKYYLISYSNRSKIPIDRLLELTSKQFLHKDIMLFPHDSNSQAFSLKNGKYQMKYDEENMELLLLLQKK